MNDYDFLIQRLDAFIRKYYADRLLKGSLIFLASVLAYVLLASIGEYNFYFRPAVKITLLAVLLLAGGTVFIAWVLVPLFQIMKLGKVISHEQAAAVIGTHFPDVSDQLLNILQLKQQSHEYESQELIQASIDQKAKKLAPIPFSKAIDLGKNRRYLWFLVPILLAIAAVMVWIPSLFKDASRRLAEPTRVFIKPAPFRFRLLNRNMMVPENDPVTIMASVEGEKLPDQVFIIMGNTPVPMKKVSATQYSYRIDHLTQPVSFRFEALDYYSDAYRISPAGRPQATGIRVVLEYPAYTGRKSEISSGISDLSVPAGTVFKWMVRTQHTDNVVMHISPGAPFRLPITNGSFVYTYRFDHDGDYSMLLSNKNIQSGDSFQAHIQVVPDQAPQVDAQVHKDDINGQQVLLTGTAGDDFGLKSLYFHYNILSAAGKVLVSRNIPLPSHGGRVQAFSYYFDIATLRLKPGEKVAYYVEAWDNDAVHGSKSGRSNIMSWEYATGKKAEEQMAENTKQINQGLNKTASEAQQIQKDMKDLQSDLLNNNDINWNQQQKMESLTEQQESLKNRVAQIQKRFEEQQKQAADKQYSDEIKQKQEALKQQLDNLQNKELAEQLKKLQELLQQKNRENAFQNLQQMEQMNKLFNMDMERVQELMKKLEMQMKLEDLARKIDELAKREGALPSRTQDGKTPAAPLKQEQEDIRKAFEQAMKDEMGKIDSVNKSLQQPGDMDEMKTAGQEAGQEMQQSSDQLDKNERQNASNSQSKAQQKMQQMSNAMKSMAAGMEMKQLDIDIKATRQLLTNLIRYSFDEEALMNQTKRTSTANPVYLDLVRKQHQLNSNVSMIKDSLFALSKRIFDIAATVNQSTAALDAHVSVAVNAMEDRRIPEAVTRQQYAMTEANNLALLLNELLSNLMQQQSMAMKGGAGGQGMPMPGGQGKGQSGQGQDGQGGAGQMMKDIITGQQQLGQGQQPGSGSQQGGSQGQNGQSGQGQGGQEGSSGQNGSGSGSGGGQQGNNSNNNEQQAEALVRLAEEQAALRRKVEELRDMLNSKGLNKNGLGNELKDIENQMNKNEEDIVNRKSSDNIRLRNRQIMTRLLQADKAIREQEQDDKRASNVGKDVPRPMPPELQKYFDKHKNLFWDMYHTAPASLAPFYRKLAEDYEKKVQKQ